MRKACKKVISGSKSSPITPASGGTHWDLFHNLDHVISYLFKFIYLAQVYELIHKQAAYYFQRLHEYSII